MRAIRVAMIGAKGVPATIGGVERHVEELSARLAAGGFAVTVYARPWYVGWSPGSTREHRGIRVVTTASIATKHLDAITHTLSATIAACRERPDIYHFHGVGPALLAWIPRIFRPRARVIVTFHCVDRRHAKWGMLARAALAAGEWAACRFPHETVTVGETLEAYCVRTYGRATVCIPNGVAPSAGASDAARAGGVLAPLGLAPRGYLLAVSRLVAHKDVHTIIRAFQQLRREQPAYAGLTLAIAGASAFSDNYGDELLLQAGGDAHIRFLGQQSAPALDVLYAHCLVFVHASRSEGLPIALLEAGAAGAVPIVSDIPEHREIIDRVGGFTFRTGDAWDLLCTLEVVLAARVSLPEIGSRIRDAVLRCYHWNDVSAETGRLYCGLVERAGAPERAPRIRLQRFVV